MNEIEMLVKQTENAHQWLIKMIDAVPEKKWDTIAKGLESNVSWQVGHQIISIYYHSIMTTVGHIPDIMEKLDLRQYTKMCSFDTLPKDLVGKTDSAELRAHLLFMQGKSLEVLRSLPLQELQNKVEPTKMPHPVAKTKFEALDWNIKHLMWHCGQIATIKRIIDTPYDFGLKRP